MLAFSFFHVHVRTNGEMGMATMQFAGRPEYQRRIEIFSENG